MDRGHEGEQEISVLLTRTEWAVTVTTTRTALGLGETSFMGKCHVLVASWWSFVEVVSL